MTKIDIAEIKQKVCQDIDNRAADLIEISHQIHQHPELNYQEKFAHDILTQYISDSTLNVKRGAFDLETAFDVSIRGGSGPTVAVLCEKRKNGLWGDRQIGNILMLRATLFCGLPKESGARCRAAKQNTRL